MIKFFATPPSARAYQATSCTTSVKSLARKEATARGLAGSHSFTVQSAEQLKKALPKGAHRTRYTGPAWPWYAPRLCSVYEHEHRCTAPSSVPAK